MFVTRAHHRDVTSALQRLVDAEHENAQALRRQLADMTAKYHQLRLGGAALPIEPAPRKEPDPIQRAITLRAGHDPKLRAQMAAQARADIAAGKSVADVERSILSGVSLDASLGLGVITESIGE